VYRTYITPEGHYSEIDRKFIEKAIRDAKPRNRYQSRAGK
jgi:maltooligosyltrehalose synthase